MSMTKNAVTLVSVLVSLAGCGGGGSGGPGPSDEIVLPPPVPIGLSATPANAQAAVSWEAAPGARSYNVYASPTSPVTSASSKTAVTTTSTTMGAVSNGAPVFVRVTAVNANGESALSSEACAVPTAASTAGLVLYDPLCASKLDGKKWRLPVYSRGVVNGALVLSTEASNSASASAGVGYVNSAIVNAAGQRVTTLTADVKVPAGRVLRDGGAEVHAALALHYQPPAKRLGGDIGSSEDIVRVMVGLVDNGGGLRAFRRVWHCDNAACSVQSSTGVAYDDPPGFDSNGEAGASYDATYTFSLSLDESTGVFTWTVTGGAMGSPASGTMNPAAYFAGKASWAALGARPLANTAAFISAALRTRVIDVSSGGGSSGSIAAEFDNVSVGFNDAPAAAWDDFSGGTNSGPTELSVEKWTGGRQSMALNAGALVHRSQITSRSTGGAVHFQPIRLLDPTGINTVQADFTVSSCTNTGSSGSNRVSLDMTLYNDGTGGNELPNTNVPNSQVGDIVAALFLDCIERVAHFQILRRTSNTPPASVLLSSFDSDVVPLGPLAVVGHVHTLRISWDPATRRVTFQADGQAAGVVDPTTANTRMREGAPYVKAPNAPSVQISQLLLIRASTSPSAVGSTASMDFRVNNVFTAP